VPKQEVFVIFGVVSITGPVLGVVTGGKIISKIGGYNSRRSFYVIIVVAFFASFCSIPMGHIHNPEHY
jgi:hypothetical protein